MASILQFSTGGLRLISRPTLEDHNHSHRVVYIGCSGPSGRGRAFGKGWRVPTSIASGNEESSLAAVPGLAKEDASLAAYDFMERVRTADVTMEELKRIAPVYQKAHELYVREVAQKIDSLQEERVNLIKELRSADPSMADYKQMVAGDMDMVRICVEQLERQCANLGMRIIVETALRDFNFKHLNGDCQDQTCRDYISSLLSKQQLTKHGRSRTIKKDGQSVQIQPYVFNTNEWSRPETIKHMAECPHATLLTQHNDALGNTLLSMSLADLKAEIRSRANPLWDQLHAPHHLLDATATRLTLKLAYGPGTSRADTLFYLSMCQAAKVAVSVTSPEAAISDVGASLRHLRDSVRGRV